MVAGTKPGMYRFALKSYQIEQIFKEKEGQNKDK